MLFILSQSHTYKCKYIFGGYKYDGAVVWGSHRKLWKGWARTTASSETIFEWNKLPRIHFSPRVCAHNNDNVVSATKTIRGLKLEVAIDLNIIHQSLQISNGCHEVEEYGLLRSPIMNTQNIHITLNTMWSFCYVNGNSHLQLKVVLLPNEFINTSAGWAPSMGTVCYTATEYNQPTNTFIRHFKYMAIQHRVFMYKYNMFVHCSPLRLRLTHMALKWLYREFMQSLSEPLRTQTDRRWSKHQSCTYILVS